MYVITYTHVCDIQMHLCVYMIYKFIYTLIGKGDMILKDCKKLCRKRFEGRKLYLISNKINNFKKEHMGVEK